MSAGKYVSKNVVQTTMANLSERDEAIVRDIGRVRMLSGNQIWRLHFQHSSNGKRLARRVLERLTDNQVLHRLDRRQGGVRGGSDSYLYCLGLVGLRAHASSTGDRIRRPTTPGLMFVRHTWTVAELYVRLVEATRQTDSITLHTYDAEPECWRTFDAAGIRTTLKPDTFTIIRGEQFDDCYFLEIDLATEHAKRITRKAAVYVDYFRTGIEQRHCGVWPQVLWLVPNEDRRDQIVGALRRLPARQQELFDVHVFDDAIPALLSEGAVV